MLIEIQVSDQSVTIALITGGTTVAVACIKAAAEVATPGSRRFALAHPRQGRSSRRPIPKGGPCADARSCARPPILCFSVVAAGSENSGTLASGGKFSTASCGEGVWPRAPDRCLITSL
jgi:hypothetical protein